jgi:integrase
MSTLIEFVDQIYLKRHLNVGQPAAEQLRVAVRLLDRCRGSRTTPRQLSESVLFDFAAWMKSEGRAPATINSRISSLLSIWREARRVRLSPRLPNVVPKVLEPKRLPRAWQLDELERLLRACDSMVGRIKGFPILQSDWWFSLLMFLYDSGARIGAALSVHWHEVDLSERTIILSADTAKTDYEQLIVISEQTADRLAKIRSPHWEFVWPVAVRREAIYRQLKQLLRRAGLPSDRKSMFHCLRKTNATWSAKHGSIELAQKQLGHRSAQMTIERYIDPRIVRSIQSVDVLPRPKVG